MKVWTRSHLTTYSWGSAVLGCCVHVAGPFSAQPAAAKSQSWCRITCRMSCSKPTAWPWAPSAPADTLSWNSCRHPTGQVSGASLTSGKQSLACCTPAAALQPLQ